MNDRDRRALEERLARERADRAAAQRRDEEEARRRREQEKDRRHREEMEASVREANRRADARASQNKPPGGCVTVLILLPALAYGAVRLVTSLTA